jgi:hypothetical protein
MFTDQTSSPSRSDLRQILIPYLLLSPCLQMDVPTPYPHPTFPLSETSSLSRIRCIFSHWVQTQKSSAVYVLVASFQWFMLSGWWLSVWEISGVQVSWDF